MKTGKIRYYQNQQQQSYERRPLHVNYLDSTNCETRHDQISTWLIWT